MKEFYNKNNMTFSKEVEDDFAYYDWARGN